ncbi:MAG: ATP-binding protein, partial [Lachnospiraceae bacterium]|nr:ATP-binding protein [Lachnospiraceae bacterium]
VRVEVTDLEPEGKGHTASITFTDWGMHYNPLEREDPDVTLSAQERQIGGLGIFLVKNMMDDVIYDDKDGANVLTLVKSW